MISIAYASYMQSNFYRTYQQKSSVCSAAFTPTRKTMNYPVLKTNRAGKTVVMGTPDKVKSGDVFATASATDMTIRKVTVVSVGKTFDTEYGPRVYGYLETPKPRKKASSGAYRSKYSRRRRSCPTGGNCSSFDNGESCGSPDCDGY